MLQEGEVKGEATRRLMGVRGPPLFGGTGEVAPAAPAPAAAALDGLCVYRVRSGQALHVVS